VNDLDWAMTDVEHAANEADRQAAGGTLRGRENSQGRESSQGRQPLPDVRGLGDFGDDEDGLDGEFYAGLASLGFIQAALRRRARFWCALAIVGLLAGVGVFVAHPAGYQATTKLLLAQPPGGNPNGWIADDQAIVQSRAVAAMALQKLGLRQDPAGFVEDYTATPLTTRVLVITVKAPSQQAALNRANALASAFLTFQRHSLNTQEHLVNVSLEAQIAKDRKRLAAINGQISRLQSLPTTPALRTKRQNLQVERRQAAATLTQLKQTVSSGEASTAAATATAINDSVVIDRATLVRQSVKKRIALYAGGGLLAGLALGMAIVVIGALASDRLRRRDDIARALGAPVRMSVRKVRLSRWRRRQRGLAAAGSKDAWRIVMYLGSATATSRSEFASLAVVPVDDVQVSAVCLTALAVSCAQRGLRVVLADLCTDAPAARLVGVAETGVRKITFENARLTVAVPHRDDIVPVGPLQGGANGLATDQDLAVACGSADLLLTLASLNPAVGAEYLAGWTSSVVAMVTAGRCSAERIHAVGEMIRLAGIPHVSAVLMGADKADESIGVVPGARVSSHVTAGPDGSRDGASAPFTPINVRGAGD
jgi:capsular polysaccharide biosynthesis protein